MRRHKRLGKLYSNEKRVARAWSPQQIREAAALERAPAQMQGAERGTERLEAARARLAPEVVQKIIVSLNAPPVVFANGKVKILTHENKNDS